MRKPDSDYGIILFNTTQAAIKAEKVLNLSGIKIKLIPVPRHISASCGVSIRFDLLMMDKIKSILNKNDVPYSKIRPLML